MYRVVYTSHNPEDSDVIRDILPAEEFEFRLRPEPIDNHDEEKLIQVCQDADAVIGDYQFFSKNVMDHLPNLKLIQFMSVGFNYVDLEYATEKGIAVANCPTYCIHEVADHALALVLAINRRLFDYADAIHQKGEWNATAPQNMKGMRELSIGILGFGAIPRLISQRLKGFGCAICAYDPFVDAETMKSCGVQKRELDDLLAESDYILCNVPALPSTIGMMNKEAFAKCKDGVVFINTSRGNIPVEKDLIEALESGKVAYAGLDVLDGEQIDPGTNVLCNMKNVIVTPHAGFYSASSRRNGRIEAANGVLAFFRGDYAHCPIRNGIRKQR